MAVWKREKVMCFCTFDFLEQNCCVFGHFRCLKQWKCQVFFDFLSAEKSENIMRFWTFSILTFCCFSCAPFPTKYLDFRRINLFFEGKSRFLTKNLDFWRKNRFFNEKILILSPKFVATGAKSRIMGKHLRPGRAHIYPLAFFFPEPVHLFPPG